MELERRRERWAAAEGETENLDEAMIVKGRELQRRSMKGEAMRQVMVGRVEGSSRDIGGLVSRHDRAS